METKFRNTSASLDAHLGYWMRRVSNQVSGNFKSALQAKHASVAEWVVLCVVEEKPGITPGELAELLGLTRGAISKVIDKLEAKGWIRGLIKPEDHRARLFSLTRKGGQVLPALRLIANNNDQAFFGVLQEEERATLYRLLFKLVESHKIDAVAME